MTTRSARRAQERGLTEHQEDERRLADASRRRHRDLLPRIAAFGVVVAVLVLGRGPISRVRVPRPARADAVAGAIAVRISMAGFDPKILDAKPGQTITLDWWNTDAAMHLRAASTRSSPTAATPRALPAESRETITLTAPTMPGDYDFWCDSCCGGKAARDARHAPRGESRDGHVDRPQADSAERTRPTTAHRPGSRSARRWSGALGGPSRGRPAAPALILFAAPRRGHRLARRLRARSVRDRGVRRPDRPDRPRLGLRRRLQPVRLRAARPLRDLHADARQRGDRRRHADARGAADDCSARARSTSARSSSPTSSSASGCSASSAGSAATTSSPGSPRSSRWSWPCGCSRTCSCRASGPR